MRLTFCQRHKLDARDKRRVTRRYFPSGVTERKTTRRSRLEQTMTAQPPRGLFSPKLVCDIHRLLHGKLPNADRTTEDGKPIARRARYVETDSRIGSVIGRASARYAPH